MKKYAIQISFTRTGMVGILAALALLVLLIIDEQKLALVLDSLQNIADLLI